MWPPSLDVVTVRNGTRSESPLLTRTAVSLRTTLWIEEKIQHLNWPVSLLHRPKRGRCYDLCFGSALRRTRRRPGWRPSSEAAKDATWSPARFDPEKRESSDQMACDLRDSGERGPRRHKLETVVQGFCIHRASGRRFSNKCMERSIKGKKCWTFVSSTEEVVMSC